MLDVNLLGTGGMVPLPGRALTALLVRYESVSVLIDCGEGTQVAIRERGLGFKRIAVICLTHFHADHVVGLPGLLLTIGNAGRTEPLTIIGPRQVGQVVDCLRVVAPQLPYPVEYVELMEGGGEAFTLNDLTISAQPVEHWIPCYAYRLELSRRPRFNAESAKRLDIPVKLWSVLQRGEAVEWDGRTVEPSAVMEGARRGIRLCYATDLRPSAELAAFARESDLFVCEGMYGDPDNLEKALEHRHCMFSEAADMARQAEVGELWLTHFSPSLTDPAEWLRVATDIFPGTRIDRHQTHLKFDE